MIKRMDTVFEIKNKKLKRTDYYAKNYNKNYGKTKGVKYHFEKMANINIHLISSLYI